MNLPNRLTILRVVLIPAFLVCLFFKNIPANYFLALAVFAVASITDALDGHIARKKNMVTNFGKFLDPLADKVLVMAALVAFIQLGFINAVPVILILAREFMVTSLRLVANKTSGKVIAAGMMGKLKTAFTMVAIVVILFLQGLSEYINMPFNIKPIGGVLIWIATILTVISGLQYLQQYKHIIDPSK